MRKILATAATLGLASLGAIVPATGAQAATPCENAYNALASGRFAAYNATNCGTLLGSTEGQDQDWGNSTGVFSGRDTNQATSLINKGTSGMRVQLFNGTGDDWAGGNTCLAAGEKISNLDNQYFSTGIEVNNQISSHRWIWSGCGAGLTPDS
ncbi:hypothetical protein OG800_20810 [Streptomyces sp. NBC_00445]|uniref:hypothetical protein n=1 Tax=unclassified Streptomyces TaxID=2593676 RepID=UPI002E1D884C|nr:MULTISPECIES: hypothetical protein [unclassified Streptomyces]